MRWQKCQSPMTGIWPQWDCIWAACTGLQVQNEPYFSLMPKSITKKCSQALNITVYAYKVWHYHLDLKHPCHHWYSVILHGLLKWELGYDSDDTKYVYTYKNHILYLCAISLLNMATQEFIWVNREMSATVDSETIEFWMSPHEHGLTYKQVKSTSSLIQHSTVLWMYFPFLIIF